MPFRLSEAPPELKDAVKTTEERADRCYQLLQLLKRPANEARWALLTAMALQLETLQQNCGAKSQSLRVRLVNLDRCTSGFRFISQHGKPESRLIEKYTWHGSLTQDANFALQVAEQYQHFLDALPMWHKDHEEVDVLPDGRVRFYIPRDSSRQRQVIAFQQGFTRKGIEIATQYGGTSTEPSPEAMRLLGELLAAARPGRTAKKFSYEPSSELIEALRPKYVKRLDENFRRPDTFQLNGYSLGEFKSFYIALLVLCSIHEYICYPFDKAGQPIPISSLVMVRARAAWIARLSQISGLQRSVCDAIISDLILNPTAQRGASMCINPFVPLNIPMLAVAPQFPLASAVDDNILRSFSYLAPDLFSAQNTEKEATMRARIKDAAPQYSLASSVELPDKSTEIDILLADEASSTAVFAELKWIRKPYRTLERIERDKEVEKGLGQLRLIRAYARQHPDFLRERGKLPRSLTCYDNVHYLLVAWDHWHWLEPEDGIAIVSFEVLLPNLRRSTSLQRMVAGLLTYNWLPIEGRDFLVMYDASVANGAVLESPTFIPGNG